MGCGNSKAEEPALVALCRERRELIRAAGEYRFALAAAHAAYFRALGRVGDAFHRFVQEELVAAAPSPSVAPAPSPSVAPASPVLTLPPSEGKGKAKAKIDGSDVDSGVVGSSVSTFVSISHAHSDGSHLHLPLDSESEDTNEEESTGTYEGGEDSVRYFPHHPSYGAPVPNYYYMKSASTVSSTVYQNPYPAWSNTAYVGYGYGNGYGYPLYGAPVDSMQPPPVQDESFYQSHPRREDKPGDPPPPPPPEGSAWDFFNPFDSYEKIIPGCLRENYGVGSATSSPNSSEVREKEGIPDLEEETEQESVKVPLKERKRTDKDAAGRVSAERSLNVAAAEQEASEKFDTVVLEVKEEIQNISSVSEVKEDVKEVNTKKKSMCFGEETSVVTEDNGPSKGNALYVHGTRDVMEVVKEIKEQFESAAICGEEVSKILEAGKLSYRSRNRILRVILSRILDAVIQPVRTSSQPSFMSSQHSAARSLKVRQTYHAACDKYVDINPGKLSSTLEKLYVWEKKLHKEVKEEERLRVIYEREWKQLKALDESGAESWRIDSIQASIRNLLTKLNMAIRSVNHISRRIHRLRDEELRPQLIELVQGLGKLWKSVLDCHHKQFQAIVESRSHTLVARTGSSIAKATIELETELLNWCSCFTNWIHTQRAYIEVLNGWLLKWLLQETEETPDGVVPFSPSRIGAPDAFIITNDWYHRVDMISEDEVIDSMQAFAINVHRLWETQDEEQGQKLKAEYLSKDFARRLRSLQENGMHEHKYVADKTTVSISNGNEAFHHEGKMSLDAIRRRLDEERAKHKVTIKQVQQATASNLRMSLVPIFKALEKFSSETLKGFEGVRISNASAGT